jgi:hypothetical protein
MLNARIDLETNAMKATTIRTLSGGIERARKALGERLEIVGFKPGSASEPQS